MKERLKEESDRSPGLWLEMENEKNEGGVGSRTPSGSRETHRGVRQAVRHKQGIRENLWTKDRNVGVILPWMVSNAMEMRESTLEDGIKKRDKDTGLDLQKLIFNGWEEGEAPIKETEKGDGRSRRKIKRM